LTHAEKLSAGLKEKVLVQEAVIQQRARLLPLTHHHHPVCASFGSHRSNAHRVVQGIGEEVLEEPIAGLPQLWFASLIEDLQVKIRLFKGWLCTHVEFLLYFFVETKCFGARYGHGLMTLHFVFQRCTIR